MAKELFPGHDLGRHVTRRASKHLGFLVRRHAGGKSKVNDFDLVCLVEKDVFQLDVTMADPASMKVGQCTYDLCEYPSRN
jgi:hypothetical protein